MTTADANAILVRSGTPPDATRLAPFAAHSFRAAFAAQVGGPDLDAYIAKAFSVPRIEGELADPGSTFLLAESGGDLVGYARLLAEEPPETVPCRRAVRMVRLYVDPGRIGGGIGTVLVAACAGHAAGTGSEGIWLRVWDRNRQAIGFYERRGFRTCGTIAFEMLGGMKTDAVMWRYCADAPGHA